METKKKSTQRSGTSSAAKKKGGSPKASPAKKGGAKKPMTKKGKGGSAPIHKAMPFIWFALALFLGACLYLNLFCNLGNSLKDPSGHWVGVVGYYVCYGIFGTFGPAAFTLPVLLGLLAFHWKRYVENRRCAPKIIASLLFLVMLSSVIHIFAVLMQNNGNTFPAEKMFEVGAQMLGGGVVGNAVGTFLFTLTHYVGSLIICFLLLAASLFYVLGMTPEMLFAAFKGNGKKRPKKATKASRRRAEPDDEDDEAYDEDEDEEEEEEEPAPARPSPMRRREKERRAKAEKPERPAKEKPERPAKKKETPPPQPNLHPGREDEVYVPDGVEATGEQEKPRYGSYDDFRRGLYDKQYEANLRKASEGHAINAAENRNNAAERVFPADGDTRPSHRTARGDQEFDLGDVFEDENSTRQPNAHRHAPVPPESPMEGDGAESTAPAAETVRKAAEESAAAPAKTPAKESAAPASKPAPEKAADAPAGAEQIAPGDSEFGLSEEEFESMEAGQVAAGTAATRQRSTKKSAAASEDNGTSTALEDAAKAAAAQAEAEKKPYVFPPLSFLHPGEPMTEENAAELRGNIAALGETLKNFHVGIQGNIRYSYGPTVTRYEVVPAPGVRVRTITNLSDDIALALRAAGGIRIEAPIPGTNTVGIEIPNKLRSTIYLRELLESKAFQESRAPLTAALGAGIAGESLVFDIAKMPHLLIAGTTGSGKSVCINCIVLSLLFRTTPEDVRLVMIDPKKVEFSIYKNIPHLLAPVVTQPKDAAGALQASVEEMERRFEYFESVGVRDLKGYNAATADDPDMPKFPHIVIIIDELADLMMTARDEVETAICRIAQKARAAGMHLIIGTQRPSADIVTGLIKANVPSRIAFAVKSQVDSRVILDHIGAEALAGRGDMLFVPIGSMRDTRVQGAFVDDKEVEAVCDFIRENNGLADYDEHFIAKLKELAAQCGKGAKGGGGGGDLPSSDGGETDGADDKYADAVRIAMEEKCIATSRLQRKLGIGYGRAAKLIDRMEREGIVSPPNGSKPRTVLISTEEYMNRFFGEDTAAADTDGAAE